MTVSTLAARAAAAVVAAVAGAASYEHIASVATSAGEDPWVSYTLPLAIDGLIVVGVAALLEDKRAGRHGRMSARFAIVVGVLGTLAANVASAAPTATARLVAVAAPAAFLLSVEVLTRSGRAMPTSVTANTPADTVPDTVADIEVQWPDIYYGAATLPDIVPDSQPDTAPAKPTDMTPDVPDTPPATAPARKPAKRRTSRKSDTAALAAKALVEQPDITTKELAALIGRSQRTASRYLRRRAVNGHKPELSMI